MKNSQLVVLVIAVIALIGGGIYIMSLSVTNIINTSDTTEPAMSFSKESINISTSTTATSTPAIASSTTKSTISTYTMSDVAVHNTRTSCWTVIDLNIYDVTSWILRHPGGEQNILSLCGKDGTAAFNDQHKGASWPENELARFKIGILKR